MYLNLTLRLFASVDEKTFRSILGQLKRENRIGHLWYDEDTWVPIRPITSSLPVACG